MKRSLPLLILITCACKHLHALLDSREDATSIRHTAACFRNAFNKRFFNDATGIYADNSQTSQILPLYLGIAPENKRELVLQ